MSDSKFDRDPSTADLGAETSNIPEHWIIPVLKELGFDKPLVNATLISITTRMEADMRLTREDIIAEIRHYGVDEFMEKYRAGAYDSKALSSRWSKGTRRIKAPDLSGVPKPMAKKPDSGSPAPVATSEPEPGGLLSSIRELVGRVSDGLPFPSNRRKTGEIEAPDFSMTTDDEKEGEGK